MKTLKYIIVFLFLTISLQITAQSDCDDELANSQELYEDGDFEGAIKKLKDLLENCDLNKTQENEALKLIASAYYEMDELEIGNEYVEKFLRKNPFYVASKKNDPYTFRETLDKFKSWARLSIGAKIGLPFTTVFTEKTYPILDTADYFQNYSSIPSAFGSIEVAYNFNNYLSFYFGFGLGTQKIKHEVPMYNNQITFKYEESSLFGNLPLYIQYKLPLKSAITSAIYIGGEFRGINEASYSYSYISNGDEEFTVFLNRKRTNFDIDTEHRTSIRKALIGGAKIVYKINKFSIFADVRYTKEFDLYNNSNSHFVNPDLYMANFYTISDIRFETIDISIGFVYNLWYKVKAKY